MLRFEIHKKGEIYGGLYKFLGIERIDSYFGKWKSLQLNLPLYIVLNSLLSHKR